MNWVGVNGRTRSDDPRGHNAVLFRLSYVHHRNLVGVAGFDPATLCPPSRCATWLRHTPIELTGAYGWERSIDPRLIKTVLYH